MLGRARPRPPTPQEQWGKRRHARACSKKWENIGAAYPNAGVALHGGGGSRLWMKSRGQAPPAPLYVSTTRSDCALQQRFGRVRRAWRIVRRDKLTFRPFTECCLPENSSRTSHDNSSGD